MEASEPSDGTIADAARANVYDLIASLCSGVDPSLAEAAQFGALAAVVQACVAAASRDATRNP